MNKIIVFLFVSTLISCNSLSELYLVKADNKWGYINRKGKLVIEPVYENCCYQRYEDSCCSRIIWPEALGVVKQNGKYGAINVNGELKLKCNYDFLDQYHNSLLIARSGNKYGILNENNDTIFPFIFDNQFISCNSETGQGQINGKYYLLDFETKTQKETGFDKISYFVEGLAAVKKGENYGFINEEGSMVIDAKYQNVWPFNQGLAAVKQNYQWGFIDTTRKFVIKPQFDETEGFDLFSGKYAIVVKNKKYGIIDREGNYLIIPKYDYLYFEDENVLLAIISENQKQKRGLINLNEKWLYEPEYENFDYFDGYIKFEKDEKFGLLKLNTNKIVIPPVFEEIAFRSKGLTLLFYYSDTTNKMHHAYINKKGRVIWSEEGFDVKRVIKQYSD
jgi:hypothetical protein